jgi:hypothetical protein
MRGARDHYFFEGIPLFPFELQRGRAGFGFCGNDISIVGFLRNNSPSGRFCARMVGVIYNKLAQMTKRPDGYLNCYVSSICGE